MRSTDWPVQRREVTQGRGSCLGATYEKSKARLGRLTSTCENLITTINLVIARLRLTSSGGHCRLIYDSVCKEHTDSNNIGPSVIMLFGDFEGGEFKYRHPTPIVRRMFQRDTHAYYV